LKKDVYEQNGTENNLQLCSEKHKNKQNPQEKIFPLRG